MRTYDFSKPIDLDNLPATLKNQMARDPATLFPGAPPLFGQDVVPHFFTTTGYIGSAARAYPIEDEATRNSTENAERMRTECAIMECLESRQRATALLNWHLAPENDKSDKQQELCHVLTQIIRRIPRFVEYRRCLLEALWYGKYAVVNRFSSQRVGGKYRTTIRDWAPRHGDKLMFRYADDTMRFVEGQLGIRVHANFAFRPGQLLHLSDEERRKKIEPTQYGLVYWFNDYERETMIVHKHMVEDGPWQDPRMMGRVMGVGIRDRIYWTWYAMQSLLQDLLTYSNRAALGVRLWRYPSGNPEWKKKVEQAAKDALANGVADVLFPVEPNDYASLYGVEQIEPGTAGAQLLAELIERFFLKKIKKYILGQLLTSEAESTGMGSGVANAHLATFADIVRYDASNLEETLTEQLVRKIQKENAPKSLGVHVRMVLDTDTPDTDKRLQAIQAAYQMDVPIRVEDIYQLTGLSKPELRDQVVSVSSQQEKQQRQQNQMMMEQQAMQAAMMGVGGQPGTEGAPPEQVPPEGEEPAQSTLDVSPEDAEKDQGPAVPASGQLEEKAALDEAPQGSNPWAGFWESFFNAARGATEPGYEMQTQQTIQQVEEEADPELVSEFQRLFDAYAENNEDPDTFIEDVREAWERHALSQDLTEVFESHRLSERLNQGFEQQRLNTRIANGVEQQVLTWHMGRLFDQYELTNAISDKLAERMKQRGVREQLLTALRKQFGKGDVERYAHQWAPYRGPREGKGWKNVSTGEVRYQEKSPDREMKPEDHLVHPRHPKNGNGTSAWRLKALDRERPYVGFDLDGTLAKSIKWQGPTVIGEPIPEMVAKAKAFLHHGIEVRIITARLGFPGKEAEAARRAIVKWTQENIGRPLKVQAHKTPGLVKLYDDKAVGVEENTGQTVERDEYCAKECDKYTCTAADIDEAVRSWSPPTPDQIKAGNFYHPRVRLHGIEVAIESPAGTSRKPGWKPLSNAYGYISRIGNQSSRPSKDAEKLDVFLGPKPDSEIVFVIDQEKPNGDFDEHKAIIGATSEDEAKSIYLANYPSGWRCGPVTSLTVPQFKAWLDCGDLTKRVAKQVSKYMARYEADPERYARKMKFDPRQKGFDFDAPKPLAAAAPSAPAAGQSDAGSPWVRMQGDKGAVYWYNRVTNPNNDPGGRKYQEEKPGDDDTGEQESVGQPTKPTEPAEQSRSRPSDVPGHVAAAILAVEGSIAMQRALEQLPEAQRKHAIAWKTIHIPQPSDSDRSLLEQAKEIAKQNDWDWGDVTELAREQLGLDENWMDKQEASMLAGYAKQGEWETQDQAKRDAKAAEADKEFQARRAAEKAKAEEDERAKKDAESKKRDEQRRRDEEVTQQVKSQITGDTSKFLNSIDVNTQNLWRLAKTKKARNDILNKIAVATGHRRMDWIEEAFDEWKNGKPAAGAEEKEPQGEPDWKPPTLAERGVESIADPELRRYIDGYGGRDKDNLTAEINAMIDGADRDTLLKLSHNPTAFFGGMDPFPASSIKHYAQTVLDKRRGESAGQRTHEGGGEAAQLLEQAAPYTEFGENYSRNIAEAVNDLKHAMSRKDGAKFIPHLTETLKMRLEANQPARHSLSSDPDVEARRMYALARDFYVNLHRESV